MASISFTDATGAATLVSVIPAPGNRFRSYKASVNDKRDVAFGLGTGQLHAWKYADIYTATLELPISNSRASQAIAHRLVKHLMAGGRVTLTTEDSESNVYTDVSLAEGTEPEIDYHEEFRTDLWYTFRATFTSQATPPVPLICVY
jgi:hypothetical protein